mgnify:CR=1 FL=1
MILVTKPFLPPIEEYKRYIDGIWERQWLTNMGPLSIELEKQLSTYLGTEATLFLTNGTIGLQMAIKGLELNGEIITTPFSFIATTSSIVWEHCKPVFVDIHPENLNIDPQKIEEAITEHTVAIVATHVYGNPCNVEAIKTIADKHNIKVIYDAAHAFGVQLNGKSVFQYGDISVCSLHATKLYHSIEGGLIFTKDKALFNKLQSMRNFGFAGPVAFDELGINGKNSEFHAAMGLVNLKYVEEILAKRRLWTETYDQLLAGKPVRKPLWHEQATQNYAYYPVLFESEEILLNVVNSLQNHNIQTRRYFYPSLANSIPYLPNQEFPVTDEVSKRVLCLPLYYEMSEEIVETICKIIIAEL